MIVFLLCFLLFIILSVFCVILTTFHNGCEIVKVTYNLG